MAIFPVNDMKLGVSGHLYPGKPAAGGSGNTIHLAAPEPLEDGARARRRERRQGASPTSSRSRPAASPIASIPTATASASSPRAEPPCAAPTASSRSSSICRGGRLVTARTLAERLEVSERTIYRDVADLIGVRRADRWRGRRRLHPALRLRPAAADVHARRAGGADARRALREGLGRRAAGARRRGGAGQDRRGAAGAGEARRRGDESLRDGLRPAGRRARG